MERQERNGSCRQRREHLKVRKGKWNGREEGSLDHRVRSRSYARRGQGAREASILTRSLFNFHVMAEAGLELPVVQFARSSSPTAILSFSVSMVGSVLGASTGTMIIKSVNAALLDRPPGLEIIRSFRGKLGPITPQCLVPLEANRYFFNSSTPSSTRATSIQGWSKGFGFLLEERGKRSSPFGWSRGKVATIRHENGTHVGRHVRRITGDPRAIQRRRGRRICLPSVGKFLILVRPTHPPPPSWPFWSARGTRVSRSSPRTCTSPSSSSTRRPASRRANSTWKSAKQISGKSPSGISW